MQVYVKTKMHVIYGVVFVSAPVVCYVQQNLSQHTLDFKYHPIRLSCEP